ncbi:EthD family reductase [Tunturibacter empetritectus]|uniref:EthD family reductase n=1 Tax=Tunturiibacter empetritectus TaxID=3069691 RepID=A0AAU7ZF95_9BACT
MIKRFVILRRRSGMSKGAFRAYWRDVHGPLIAAIPGVRKYVQFHVDSEINPEEDEPIDGIAELWFDSKEAQVEAWSSPQYAFAVADEPNLFDSSSRSIHPVMEIETVILVPEGGL